MAPLPWLAPCTPHWLTVEREAAMQIDDRILNCTAFLGLVSGDQFHAEGTGFFAGIQNDNYDFIYLVTAAHVIWPERRHPGNRDNKPSGQISVRVNTKHGTARNITTNRADWIFSSSKNIDLCTLRFSRLEFDANEDLLYCPLHLVSISLITENDVFAKFGIPRIPHPLVTAQNVMLGDDVFLAGAFISHIGAKRNIPIVRIGNIAALPIEPVEYFSPTLPAYLLETRSLGGLSGSPVFLHLYPERMRGDSKAMGRRLLQGPQSENEPIGMPYILIGMVLGTPGSSFYRKDFLDDTPTDSEFNSGISVVLPISNIIEFLYVPELIDERKRSVESRANIAGYRR